MSLRTIGHQVKISFLTVKFNRTVKIRDSDN